MDKKNIFKKPIIVAVIVAAVVCIVFAVIVSEVTAVRINDIESYEDIFVNVEKIKFYRGDDNFFTTVAPAEKLRAINRVKIKKAPASEDRSEDRAFGYRIDIDGKYVIYISDDFSELWIDDGGAEEKKDKGLLPSFSYTVRNPRTLKKLFPQPKKIR